MRRISEAPDYWVPESYMYKTAEECIEAWPDDPAAGCFESKWQRKYDKAVDALKVAKKEFKDFRDGWDCDSDAHKYNTPCRCCCADFHVQKIDAILHELGELPEVKK